MKAFLNKFCKAVEMICVALMCIMVVVIFLATFGRYSKLFSIAWSEELARYCMIGIVYMGLMLASRDGGHFVVEVAPMIFPRRVMKVITVIVVLFVDGFAVFLCKYGWSVSAKMLSQGKLSPMMSLPLGAVYLLIPIGVLLMAVFYTIHSFVPIGEKNMVEERNESEEVDDL